MTRHNFRIAFDAHIEHNGKREWVSPDEVAEVRKRLRRGLPPRVKVVGAKKAQLWLKRVRNVSVKFIGSRKKWTEAKRAARKATAARKRTTRKKK